MRESVLGELGFMCLSLRELLQIAVCFCKRAQVGELGM